MGREHRQRDPSQRDAVAEHRNRRRMGRLRRLVRLSGAAAVAEVRREVRAG